MTASGQVVVSEDVAVQAQTHAALARNKWVACSSCMESFTPCLELDPPASTSLHSGLTLHGLRMGWKRLAGPLPSDWAD